MMGRSHAVSGLLAGEVTLLPFSPGREAIWPGLLPVTPWPVAGLYVMLVGGAALLPDLDHENSTVTRSLWFVTGWASDLLCWFNLEIYDVTAGPRDPDRKGGHRLLTHTPVGALLFGGATAALFAWLPLGGVAFVGFLVALMANGRGRLGLGLLAIASVATWLVVTGYPGWWWLWGIAVALGCHVHREGDWCTVQGVPRRSWPRMVNGRRWDTDRAPFAFTTNSPVESTWVYPGLLTGTIAAGITVVGLLPPVLAAIVQIAHAIREATA